ncbi:Hint domain-containing protein [uncultured Roseovarius sp.]|uniref:Hint domain-containing protein n=1 Tax=uncultured Roseovarius sp. TaxID=293344 RepID=UPI00260B6B00|nr:Hint domain-containing protein [uncultured Roseovarius sp.]
MADALLGGIVINEVLIDPTGANNFDTDQSGAARGGDEFIELLNTSSSAIDISGLELWDAVRDNWFTFPPGSVLQPGARATVVRNVQSGGSLPAGGPDDLQFDANFGRGVFNNNRDNIVVYDPANDEFIQATYNGDTLDDPTTGSQYAGFSTTATRVGSGEDFGSDIDGFSIQRFVDGSDNFSNDQTPTPSDQNVCFTTGVMIETPAGPVAVEDLRVGDRVLTRDSGERPITWIFSQTQSADHLKTSPNLRPIIISAGALGNGVPNADLRVSAQHRIAVSGKIAMRMYGEPTVLVAAIHLLQLPGVRRDEAHADVTYFHIMFDRHEIVFANATPAESLYLGGQAILAISKPAWDELFSLFPNLEERMRRDGVLRASPFAEGHKARKLVLRHLKNNKPLCDVAMEGHG